MSGTPTASGTFTFLVTATDSIGATGTQSLSIVVNPIVSITTTTLPAWTKSFPTYNQSVAATGGTGTVTFSTVNANLPPGITLSSAGLLSGTPTASGTFSFLVTATDSIGATGTQSLSIVINQIVSITTTTLPPWTKSFATYSQSVAATGGTGTVTFSTVNANLPAGITLSSAGLLSGTPAASGTFTFLVTATDSIGATGTQSLTIVVNPIVSITTTTLPAWTNQYPTYNQTLAKTGGTGTVTFSTVNANLPPGITLNSAGLLSGTPTASGTFTFLVTATDSIGAIGTQSLSIVVNPFVVMITVSLPPWTKNFPTYSQTIVATGGTGTVTFTAPANNLPTGMTLSSSGVLSGTPSVAGSFTFDITATDSIGDFDFVTFTVVINPIVAVTTASLPDWTSNFAGYSSNIAATGGTGTLTFTTVNANLPTGLTLSSAGVLSGKPTVPGTYNFTVTATDSVGATGTKAYTVKINAPIAITTATLPNWTANFAGYSSTISTTGGTGTLVLTTVNANLPTGLVLSTAGVLSGTPTVAGTYIFTVTATDTVGSTSTLQYTVKINAPIAITTATLPNWTANLAGYTTSIAATGGTGTLSFSTVNANLPTGLSLSSAGVLSGTPTVAGSFTFVVTAADTVGATGTQSYTVKINPVIAISTATLPSWTAGLAYSQTVVATGGTGTLAFTVTSGILPAGLSLASATGVISGTPTTAGTQSITVTVTDSVGASKSQQYTLQINSLIVISTTSPLAIAKANKPYNQTISATGGTGTLALSATAASLPPGLTLTAAGILSGSPTAKGSYSFLVTATDSVGATIAQTYALVVVPSDPPSFVSLTVTPNTLPIGQPVSVTAAITTNDGLPASVNVNFGDGTLPVTIAPYLGSAFTHVYSVVGTYAVTVTATSTDGLLTSMTAVVTTIAVISGSNGNVIGKPGLPVTLGYGGQCSLNFGTPSKSTFTNSRVVNLNLPAALTQNDLTGLPGTLTIGYGTANAVTYPFSLTSKGNAKTPLLKNIAFSVKDKVTQFSTTGDARLLPLMQALGVSSVAKSTETILVPVSLQIGDKIFFVVQYSMAFSNPTGKTAAGKLAQ